MARTAQDDEDEWKKELSEFVPAPMLTEADEAGDLSSIYRRLDRPLRLAVKQR